MDSGTQTAAVPERAKSHRTLPANLKNHRVLAAELTTGSIDTSVASGPHSPRPKDCPGLGDPNTLKIMKKKEFNSMTHYNIGLAVTTIQALICDSMREA